MTKRDDGGPAFPGERSMWAYDPSKTRVVRESVTAIEYEGQAPHAVQTRHDGMSLRDWFAGQALAGLASASDTASWPSDEFASMAYTIADAMLAERRKESTDD